MSELRIVPIENTKKDIRRFVKSAWRIYRNDPHWVPPIIFDLVFRIHKGPYHETGIIQPFMAFRGGEPVGRIIAHYDNYYNSYYKAKRGAVGFFECIDDAEVSRGLFRTAENWLAEKGMNEIYGPQNFLVYDDSGLLIDNFEDDPVAGCAYNPPYYEKLFLDYGFVKDVDWYSFLIRKDVLIPDNYLKIWRQVRDHGDELTFRPTRISLWNRKASMEESEKIREVFNRAWAGNYAHLPGLKKNSEYLVDLIRWLGIPELTVIVEHKGRMVGYLFNIPDINQAIKKADGRLFPFGIFKLLMALRKIKRGRVVMGGVLPEYRHSGIINLSMFLESKNRADERGFEEYDLSLVLENNDSACRGIIGMGGRRYKTYRFYRKPVECTE